MWIEKREIEINDPKNKGKKKSVIRYKYIERFKSPLTGKYKKVSITFNKNNASVRKEATFQLEEKIKQSIQKENSVNTNITLQELKDKFLDLYKQQSAYSTYYSAKNGLKRFCNDFGNDTLAKKISPKMLNKYLDDRLYNEDKPLTNGGILLIKKHISLLFKFAVKYGYLKENPVEKVEITLRSEKQRKKKQIENKYLTDEEYNKIIEDCMDRNREDLADIFQWLFYTGMRFGEAAALQIKNIFQDKDKNWIARVEGSIVVYRGKDAPKNGKKYTKTEGAKSIAGNRDVILPEPAVEIYKRNARGKAPDDFLFVNKVSGYPMRESAANRYLHRLEDRKNISKTITTHFFRHTHVSKLAELGVPLYVIQRRVGHENSKITEQVYLHVTGKAEKSLIEKLNQLAPSVPPEDSSKDDDH